MHASTVRAAVALFLAASIPFSLPARAQEREAASAEAASSPAAAPDAERAKLEEQIRRELGSPPPRARDPRERALGVPTPTPRPELRLLPDISAIGSASAGWESETRRPRFFLDEVEVAFQAIVDPYARADVYVSFFDEGAEVEEAFVTTLALPGGLQLRAGKFFSPFGRLNQLHFHTWEFIDAPLARGLIAEEVMSGTGVSLSWLAPVRWFAELQIAAQNTALAHGHGGPEPEEEEEARLTGLARLSQFFPLGEATTLGVGLSAARRSEARGEFRDLAGADVYLRLRPHESRSYLALSGEVHAVRFAGVEGLSREFETGWWVQAFGRAGRFFGAGVRYDRAPFEEDGDDHAVRQRVTALFGYFPSEFQRIRLQASYDRMPGGENGFSALLNLEFGIGVHGAHPF
jgi:hypothetical protein